ncbi:protoporphyrinogen oxidase [Leptospira fainei serovar Hurstbridge str. BUT 6]|uniref:Coproporphyrinogen III oxidase n=1 Tax=Leptospira fainei serovar Hurstbridge str. BUT 6 TaxID=1193011 RepID=S3UWH1_9LEPT|nr:protoporphyrinogen oxidase [Leptospira fainei]EPG72704.1 protoporphyrinogen oxidase [Leptospira fainei serovar Hurstbridge str. BUT 6]
MAKSIPDRVIIGAGFTGLVHAFLAIEKGESVLVLEKRDGTGGLIRSVRTEYGIVETAANGILNCWELEKLASRLGLDILLPDSASRRRYIFSDGKPRRLPLKLGEIIRLVYGAVSKPSKPEPGESVLRWGKRVLGEGAVSKIVEPALGGIYAGDLDLMSAEFVFGKFLPEDQTLWNNLRTYSKSLKSKPRLAPARRGTVSFRGGIGTLVRAMEARVIQDGKILYNEDISSLRELRKRFPGAKITIATGLASSLRILKSEFPELKTYQGVLELLPIVSVTRFGRDSVLKGKKGFGILFPKDHKSFSSELGLRVRGILFNDFIWPSRAEKGIHSETYVYGGAGDREIATKSEDEIINIVEDDRKKLIPDSLDPVNHYVTVWKEALPVYGPQLYAFNKDLDRILPADIKVEGNFRQGIGLKSILERAFAGN